MALLIMCEVNDLSTITAAQYDGRYLSLNLQRGFSLKDLRV